MSSKDFLTGFDQIWKRGPDVKYTNPEHIFRQNFSEGRAASVF
jgi:hypothetical protein